MKLRNFTEVFSQSSFPADRRHSPVRPAHRSEDAAPLLDHAGASLGGLLDVAQLAANLGGDEKTAQRYIGLLCALLLVRRLPSWHKICVNPNKYGRKQLLKL